MGIFDRKKKLPANSPMRWTAEVKPLAKKGLSAEEIAHKLGVKTVQVSRVLSGLARVYGEDKK
jgi:hypothetical protein